MKTALGILLAFLAATTLIIAVLVLAFLIAAAFAGGMFLSILVNSGV